MEDKGKGGLPKTLGHFKHAAGGTTLAVWLEEDGFFRLQYEQKEDQGFTANEERGTFYTVQDQDHFELAVVERQWKWKDGDDGDSGVDATDLKYPATVKSENQITLRYLDTDYELTRV